MKNEFKMYPLSLLNEKFEEDENDDNLEVLGIVSYPKRQMTNSVDLQGIRIILQRQVRVKKMTIISEGNVTINVFLVKKANKGTKNMPWFVFKIFSLLFRIIHMISLFLSCILLIF